jgi:membrane-associated PAP2 superfamily phosphatase
MPERAMRFWVLHAIVPVLLFIVLVIVGEWFTVDLWLARHLYQLEGGQWSLKNDWLFSVILHDHARKLLVMFALSVLILALSSLKISKLKCWKKHLWFLFLALITPPILVAIGKTITHMDCPWSLSEFGGSNPYFGLFENHPGIWNYGKCFPAGHASGGYSLIALYFFFLQVRPKWKKYGLYLGLFTGLVFGIVQQLRGAHFVSHDLWSLAICWASSLTLYWFFYESESVTSLQHRSQALDSSQV